LTNDSADVSFFLFRKQTTRIYFLSKTPKQYSLIRLQSTALSSPFSPAMGSVAAGKVSQNHYQQMGCKPDVVCSNILINENQYQNSRDKRAQNGVSPQGKRIVRKAFEQKISQQSDAREKERKQ
jgi:hypothetical protein